MDINLLCEELDKITKNVSGQLSLIDALCEPKSVSIYADDDSDSGSDIESNTSITVFELMFSATFSGNGVANRSTNPQGDKDRATRQIGWIRRTDKTRGASRKTGTLSLPDGKHI